jgi:hypothetical protein
VRSFLIPAALPCPLLNQSTFPRLHEITVPFSQLRDGPPGRLQQVLEQCSRITRRKIVSVAIPAVGTGSYTLCDAAKTAAMHNATLLALAQHQPLEKLIIGRIKTSALRHVADSAAGGGSSVPLFGRLRHLETKMRAAAAVLLVELLLQQPPPPLSSSPPSVPKPPAMRSHPLTALRATILNTVAHVANADGTCTTVSAVLRACGQLHALRQLDVRFAGIVCEPTATDFAVALHPLLALRDLTIMFLPVADGRHRCLWGYARCPFPFAYNPDALTHGTILDYAANRPDLRTLALVLPRFYGAGNADDILARLGQRCRRLERLQLTGRCSLRPLLHASEDALPRFPELRFLDVDFCREMYVSTGRMLKIHLSICFPGITLPPALSLTCYCLVENSPHEGGKSYFEVPKS